MNWLNYGESFNMIDWRGFQKLGQIFWRAARNHMTWVHIQARFNAQQIFFFSDLSCEGNTDTETITSTTQATDGNLLKLQDGFEIKND